MDDESEQALLIGNQNKSNTMMYTDGPTVGGVGASLEGLVTPPSYENIMQNEAHCHENQGKKTSLERGSDASHGSETLTELSPDSGVTLLEQFNADALKQVGFGKYQLIVISCTGMALATYVAYFFSLFFIMPSIDLEFCMTPENITNLFQNCLLFAALGALIMTSIAEISGRKKALCGCFLTFIVCCLVEPFMPTRFSFMALRFFATAYGASIFPIGATYICEMCPSNARGRALGLFAFIGSIGGFTAASVAYYLLPTTGEELFKEYQTHFSGWRTYLLAMALPFTIPFVCLLLLSESPRWLLGVGREVEALKVYQKMYRFNHSGGSCTFTEMELPRMLPGARIHLPKTFKQVFHGFMHEVAALSKCCMCKYQPLNLVLLIIWFFAMFNAVGLALKHKRYEKMANNSKILFANNIFKGTNSFSNAIKASPVQSPVKQLNNTNANNSSYQNQVTTNGSSNANSPSSSPSSQLEQSSPRLDSISPTPDTTPIESVDIIQKLTAEQRISVASSGGSPPPSPVTATPRQSSAAATPSSAGSNSVIEEPSYQNTAAIISVQQQLPTRHSLRGGCNVLPNLGGDNQPKVDNEKLNSPNANSAVAVPPIDTALEPEITTTTQKKTKVTETIEDGNLRTTTTTTTTTTDEANNVMKTTPRQVNGNGNIPKDDNTKAFGGNDNDTLKTEPFYDVPLGSGGSTTELPPGVLYRVKATYGYVKEDADELSFEIGDIIRVIEYDDPEDQEEGWLMGQKEGTQEKGLFPANFTRPI